VAREGLPDMVRVVVGVDPSGSGDVDNADNDAIGIVVGGLGTDGNAYLLEDCTVKAGPATWGRIAVSAWQRHDGDAIVGETNYGGEMVMSPSAQGCAGQGVRPTVKKVTASRGKVQRAEPFSALYEQGKIRHAGEFRELEDEMTAFSTYGYLGENSPTVPTHGSGCWRSCSRVWSSRPGREEARPRKTAHRRSAGWMG
jgi:phage terminase large subunit-like protein